MKKTIILKLLLLLLLTGCSFFYRGSNSDDIDYPVYSEFLQPTRTFSLEASQHGYLGVKLLEHINDFLPNRLAFSNRELETADWIVSTLIDFGFDEKQIEVQTFYLHEETSSWWGSASHMIEWYAMQGYYDNLERLDFSQNIILTIPGKSKQTIIIGAHYDGVANPGISDNASGVAMLLENAYRMRDADNYYTLKYIFFGAEEVGLIGSFYYVDNMHKEEIENLVLMINIDVIMDGPELVFAIGFIESMPEFPMTILFDMPEISQNKKSTNIIELAYYLNENKNINLISKPPGISVPTDHLPFIQFGIPVMTFFSTHPVEYPEVFIGDVLHSEKDCLDFIMENFPGRVERALFELGIFLEAVVQNELVQ